MKYKIDTSSIVKKDNIKKFGAKAPVRPESDCDKIINDVQDNGKLDSYLINDKSSQNGLNISNTVNGLYDPLGIFNYISSETVFGKKVKKIVKKSTEKKLKERETLLSGKLEELGNWYIENVPTYGTSTYKNPFVSYPARADCTGFAAVYMSMVSGVELPTSSSYFMVDPNGEWATKAKEAGWNAYTSDEITSLKVGDVLVANSGRFYSDSGHHAEVYIDEEHTFGWGTVWNTYPRNNPIKTTTESDGHVHFRDFKANGACSHDYITVYRYEPEKIKTVEDKK